MEKKSIGKLLSISTACLLGMSGVAMAADPVWVNWQNDQNFANGGNWNTLAAPGAGDNVWINQPGLAAAVVSGNSGTVSRLIMENGGTLQLNTGGSLTFSSQVDIGNGAGSAGHIVVNGGTLTVGGYFGLGMGGLGSTLTINSGTVNANGSWLIAGYGAGSSGAITVNGGQLNTASILYLGLYGAGSMSVSGGSVTAAGFNMGALGSSLTIGNGGVVTDTAGWAHNSSNPITINGSGELIFQNSAWTLADVQWMVAHDGFSSTSGTLGATQVAPGSFMVSVVPEPTTLALAGIGLASLLLRRRK